MNEENESQTPEEDTEGNQAEASTENSLRNLLLNKILPKKQLLHLKPSLTLVKVKQNLKPMKIRLLMVLPMVKTPNQMRKEAPIKKEETAEDLLKSELAEVKIRRAKGSKNITNGIVNVTATFNNTKVNITDMRGNTISWSSSGKCNFRGSRSRRRMLPKSLRWMLVVQLWLMVSRKWL